MSNKKNEFCLLTKRDEKLYVGINNPNKEKSCYVSVIIQTLFYFEDFRNLFIKEVIDEKNEGLKILIELQKIIREYNGIIINGKNNDDIGLDSLAFRKELSLAFKKQSLYTLYETGDPMELLNNLLLAFHTYLVNKKCKNIFISDPPQCKPLCLIHNMFQLLLTEETQCLTCKNKKIERIRYASNLFAFVLYTKEILKYSKINDLPFEEIIESLFIIATEVRGQISSQCDKCKQMLDKTLKCDYTGKYLLINCVWTNDEKVKMEHIIRIYYMLPLFTSNADIFECNEKYDDLKYELKGLILYWLNHYVCAFKEGYNWIFYDDAKVIAHNSWENLVKYLIKNHYRPVGIFYSQIDEIKWNQQVPSKLTKKQFDEEIKHYQVIKADLVKIDNKLETPIEYSNKEKNMEKDFIDKSTSNKVIKEEEKKWICKYCKYRNLKTDEYCGQCHKSNAKSQIEHIQSSDIKESKEMNVGESGFIRSIKTNEWKCVVNNCGCINEYSQYRCEKCHILNEVAKMVYEKELNIQHDSLNQNIEENFWNCNKCGSNNLISEEKCNCELQSKDTINQQNKNHLLDNVSSINSQANGHNIGKSQSNLIKCSICLKKNKPSNSKCSYCNKNFIGVNKDDKEIDKVKEDIYANIKEDEWVCENCDSVNKNTTWKCFSCTKTNSVIKEMIQQKNEFENQKRLKKNHPFDLKDEQKEELEPEPDLESEDECKEGKKKKDIEADYWECTCGVKNINETHTCFDCNKPKNLIKLCKQCRNENITKEDLCKICLNEYFCNVDNKTVLNNNNYQKSIMKNQSVIIDTFKTNNKVINTNIQDKKKNTGLITKSKMCQSTIDKTQSLNNVPVYKKK